MINKIQVNIIETFDALLHQEDIDKDNKITIDDNGPKKFILQDVKTNEKISIEGTYYLSNLLQELAKLKKKKEKVGEISLDKIFEPPSQRISRKIKEEYWDGLTRTIDKKGLEKILKDDKAVSSISTIYVSQKDSLAVSYFTQIQKKLKKFQVKILPEIITEELDFSLNKEPGILALALKNDKNKIEGVPFVVPGGRFNEMYGWDSYFIVLGLLIDKKVEMAKNIAENLKYQINHYGKILNANRSYFLSRSQPPVYSSIIIEILKHEVQTKDWISSHLNSIIKEYHEVWMQNKKRLTSNGLNRYKAEGIGMPFEVEPGHFDDILKKYAKKYNISLEEFSQKYLDREIINEELDIYFSHDRSMRESGHDTTSRLIGVCNNLNTVAINALLYKYEIDIAYIIKTYFNNKYKESIFEEKSFDYWNKLAQNRKELVDKYLWNENESIYYDYNFKSQNPHIFESATTFIPLWAGMASKKQAKSLIEISLKKFKMKGGIAGSSKKSMAMYPEFPIRQWDYPFGWAPHQIFLWIGLKNYNFEEELQEMIYRWLWVITKNASQYNGTIPEKFDLKTSSHKVFAEYGNVGTEFSYIVEEGFGWMNASYQLGILWLKNEYRKMLDELVDPDEIFKNNCI